ncbi:MAG: hypothetical protein SFX18_08345 [Pirellulales bacterium]|nr:hypothetical protein [Pirellulales bacterium]
MPKNNAAWSPRAFWRLWMAVFCLITCLLALTQSQSQILRQRREPNRGRPLIDRLRQRPAADGARAYAGKPFGSGYARFQLPAGTDISVFTDREFTLTEKNGRALYAVYDAEPVRNALRNALNLQQTLTGQPFTVTVEFLFSGNDPLELTLHTPQPLQLTVIPEANPQAQAEQLRSWWDNYAQSVKRAVANSEYPPTVDTFLLLTLQRRLGLPQPREGLLANMLGDSGINQLLGTLLGTESLRLAMQKETLMAKVNPAEIADQPLPAPLQPLPVEYAPADPHVAIEPIALRVPHECFYVRFGNFGNFLWLQEALNEWGGDVGNLLAFRALDYGATDKIQNQLILKQGALAKLLGPTVIQDVALIGLDTYVRDGAAIGMLFHARNNFALGTDFRGQRRELLRQNKAATEQQVEIAGRKVSFISTPDNRVRSFYATDGDFHLVTTSRSIVERFYAVRTGEGSLGQSSEFRSARTRMPLTREDTIFAYLSEAFFQQFTSPAVRVEMSRRMHSALEMDHQELAVWMARQEGFSQLTADKLVTAGYLPPEFNRRADGSQLIAGPDGKLWDSIRGAKGSFLPIADMPVTGITPSEARAYGEFSQKYLEMLPTSGAIGVAIQRFNMPPGPPSPFMPIQPGYNTGPRERIVIDVAGTLVPKAQADFLRQYLSQPTTVRAAPLATDQLSLELVTNGALFGGNGSGPTHNVFGVHDQNLAWQLAGLPWQNQESGFVMPRLDQLPQIYLAAWPNPGLLSLLLGNQRQLVFDDQGYAAGQQQLHLFAQPVPTWYRQQGTLSIFALSRDTIASVANQFMVVEAPRPAQVWLHVADLSQSQTRSFATALGYFQARKISLGNLRLLHVLTSQLGVPVEGARQVAEELLQARLRDPLGGEYVVENPTGLLPRWQTTAWGPLSAKLLTQVPPEFVSPPLGWFRGLDADAALVAKEATAHIELEMQRASPADQPAVTVNRTGKAPAATPSTPQPTVPPVDNAEEIPPGTIPSGNALPSFSWPSFKFLERPQDRANDTQSPGELPKPK